MDQPTNSPYTLHRQESLKGVDLLRVSCLIIEAFTVLPDLTELYPDWWHYMLKDHQGTVIAYALVGPYDEVYSSPICIHKLRATSIVYNLCRNMSSKYKGCGAQLLQFIQETTQEPLMITSTVPKVRNYYQSLGFQPTQPTLYHYQEDEDTLIPLLKAPHKKPLSTM